MNLTVMLKSARELALQAGQKTLSYFGKPLEVQHKHDASPLTEADQASHQLIFEGLKSLPNPIPIISEEGQSVPFEERQTWEKYWLVDPLDGTKEFIKAIPDYTINIALIQHGQPVLGVVVVPATHEQFFAAKGMGAFKVEEGKTKRIETCQTTPECLRFAISRSHPSEELSRFLNGFGGSEILKVGSALKMCRVSEGEVDAYPRMGPIMEWDTAAAHAVLLEAGGLLADWNKNPLGYNKPILTHPGFLVSSNLSTDQAIRAAWEHSKN